MSKDLTDFIFENFIIFYLYIFVFQASYI